MSNFISGKNIKHLVGFSLGLVLALVATFTLTGGTALSQTPAFKVGWNLPNPPTEGRVGLRLGLLSLELANEGSQPWPSGGANALKLGYRWFTSDNKPVDSKSKDNGYDYLPADLPKDIPPGGRLLYPQFLVGVPNAPGDYNLHIDLVQGTEGWLATKGSPDLTIKVSIKPRDATAPTTTVRALPLFTTSTSFQIAWNGQDEDGGSGLVNYDIQFKTPGDSDWRDWLLNTSATSALFTGEEGKLYLFRSRATDRAGNVGKYPDNEQASTRVDSLPPSAKVETLPAQSAEVFLVRWSSFDNIAGAATALCDVQYRVGSDSGWIDWQLGNSTGAALFRGQPGQTYYFRVRATDYAGNQGDYPTTPQANTTIEPALDTLFALPVAAISPVMTATTSPTATTAPATTTAAATTTSATVSATTAAATTTVSGTTAASTTGGATTASDTVSGTTTSATTAGAGTTSAATTAAVTTPAATTATASPSPTATATPAPTGPQSVFFPLAVKNGDNGVGTTTLLVYNPNSQPLDIFVRFNNREGAPISTTVGGQLQPLSPDAAAGVARVETVLKTIQPGETLNVWAGIVQPSTYNGWVELRAASPFQASAVRQPVGSRPFVYASALSSKQLYLPYVKKADAVSSSAINIANPNADVANFTITYYDSSSGNVVATEERTLPRYGSLRFSANGIATSDPNLKFQASAVISSNVALTANVETTLEDGSPLSYPAVVTPDAVAPQRPVYREVAGINTATLVQNTTKDTLTVRLEYLDSKGVVVAVREQRLAGYGRLTSWTGDVKELNPGFAGRVRVSTTSNSPLAVLVLGANATLNGRPFTS